MTGAIAGCYVHLPFCDRICPYCDFAVVRYDRSRARRYVAALLREIAESPAPRHPIGTVFLGGGTPSALDAEQVTRVIDAIFEKFDIARGDVECTLEANPTRRRSCRVA
jgi:oxygen-independent coproporphyrinogen-3 oxidase